MNHWKERDGNPVKALQFWTGTAIETLAAHEIFVYGSNPQGINGAGAAKAAMRLSKGAKHGIGRGFNGSNAYALVTKSLKAGFLEKSTGVLYDKEGYCSVSPEQIRTNIDELYEVARRPEHKDKKFLISYQYECWPNGAPKKSLNGYSSQEMLEMFVKDKEVPPNIVFHESYKPFLTPGLNPARGHDPSEGKYHLFFHSKSPFSQWHPSFFVYKNRMFISAEHFMMFSKAMLFKDNQVSSSLMNLPALLRAQGGQSEIKPPEWEDCATLIEAFQNQKISSQDILNDQKNHDLWQKIQKVIKKQGKLVKGFDERAWKEKRFSIVGVGNREKFDQNPGLKKILISTPGPFAEASPYDRVWGIGLSKEDPRALNKSQWLGLNLLGDVLDELQFFYMSLDATPLISTDNKPKF